MVGTRLIPIEEEVSAGRIKGGAYQEESNHFHQRHWDHDPQWPSVLQGGATSPESVNIRAPSVADLRQLSD